MKELAIKYGVIMFGGFAALFLVFFMLGLAPNFELRWINGFVHLTVLYMLIRAYRRAHPETRDNYVTGVAIGMVASTLGVLAFTAMIFFTLNLDPHFFAQLRNQSPLPEYFTPFNASLYIAVEGIVVSLIGSYIITRIVDARYDHSPAEGKVTQSLTGQ
ncbi:MAG: hypothetical protein GC192_22105 [Bacteroidetes bacterium]|nr:hypothetical protein [Bacteroidota bacterium]